jgi:hypothetical protein
MAYGDKISGYNDLNVIKQPGSDGDNIVQFNGTVNLGGIVNNTAANYSSTGVRVALVTATLAEINAGKTLLAAVAGKVITVVGYQAKVLGNFAATTAVLVQDTTGTPVVIATNAVAALTTGAILNETTANVTMGAGYLAALAAGKGIVVANSGSAATGGTSITFRILYTIA